MIKTVLALATLVEVGALLVLAWQRRWTAVRVLSSIILGSLFTYDAITEPSQRWLSVGVIACSVMVLASVAWDAVKERSDERKVRLHQHSRGTPT